MAVKMDRQYFAVARKCINYALTTAADLGELRGRGFANIPGNGRGATK